MLNISQESGAKWVPGTPVDKLSSFGDSFSKTAAACGIEQAKDGLVEDRNVIDDSLPEDWQTDSRALVNKDAPHAAVVWLADLRMDARRS